MTIITNGTKAECAAVVADWNANTDLYDEGPATLRFRPELGGWIATFTRWA